MAYRSLQNLQTRCFRLQWKKDKQHYDIRHLIFPLKEKGILQVCNKTLNLKVAIIIRRSTPITMVSWN